jgi:hypothetical protein
MYSHWTTNLCPPGGPSNPRASNRRASLHSKDSSESIFNSTPTGSNRSSLSGFSMEFPCDFLANPNIRLPPIPPLTRVKTSLGDSQQSTSAAPSQHLQRPSQLPVILPSRHIVQQPQPTSRLTDYPILHSLQKFINWATLSNVLSFKDFSETFEHTKSIETQRHAQHCIQQAAYDSFTVVHRAHSMDRTKKTLEKVEGDGTYLI